MHRRRRTCSILRDLASSCTGVASFLTPAATVPACTETGTASGMSSPFASSSSSVSPVPSRFLPPKPSPFQSPPSRLFPRCMPAPPASSALG